MLLKGYVQSTLICPWEYSLLAPWAELKTKMVKCPINVEAWVWMEPGDAFGNCKILTSLVYKVAFCPGAKAHPASCSSEHFRLIKNYHYYCCSTWHIIKMSFRNRLIRRQRVISEILNQKEMYYLTHQSSTWISSYGTSYWWGPSVSGFQKTWVPSLLGTSFLFSHLKDITHRGISPGHLWLSHVILQFPKQKNKKASL